MKWNINSSKVPTETIDPQNSKVRFIGTIFHGDNYIYRFTSAINLYLSTNCRICAWRCSVLSQNYVHVYSVCIVLAVLSRNSHSNALWHDCIAKQRHTSIERTYLKSSRRKNSLRYTSADITRYVKTGCIC